ncbi:hypothetical protein F4803DRAFT_365720 [Xylaria telfairii]|nr:hypothetical protein F4803DRAFT_365720 [Xylaria telfairii]
MRRHIITLVLTTGTLVSTDATGLSNRSRDKDAVLLPRRQPGIASGLDDLDRRNWVSLSAPKSGFTKRDRTYRYTSRDEIKRDHDHDSDDDGDGDDDDHDEYEGDHKSTSGIQPSQSTSILTTSTSTPTIPTPTGTDLPSTSSSINLNATPSPSSSPSPVGENNGIESGDGHPEDPANPESHGHGVDNNGGTSKATAIATGVVGGLLLLLILLLIWYWIMVRPKRRERSRGQHTELPKDSDIESHVTVDLRNGPRTPHDAGSSSDALPSHAMPSAPVIAGVGAGAPPGHVLGQGQQMIFESAARSIPPSPGASQAEPYHVAYKMASATSSPGMGHGPFANTYAVPHPAYSQEQLRSYSPMGGSPQGGIPPGFPPQGRPSPLQIDAFPTHAGAAPTAMELDGRPPPPRYPDAIAASQVPGPSPTSPLPVSPLSVVSPHLGPHAVVTDEPPYHPQRYQGPRQPSYGDYEPSSLPEVVSPICQLGQTSATLPEYDESAEAAWSGAGNHNNLVSQNQQGSDEKQALSSQQPMPRY